MSIQKTDFPADPPHTCLLCPRLAAFIAGWRAREPEWFNGPVPTFVPKAGEGAVRTLVIGLAPGVRGANRTGRPFTGDYAGDLLYSTLIKYGFAKGVFEARPDDSLEMIDVAITNAVRCVPPENKPEGAEINTCRQHYLLPTIARFPNLEAIVTLGTISHQTTIRALGHRVKLFPFSHGGEHEADKLRIFSSYHCSRYNTNTGKLTTPMFESVFARVREYLNGSGG